MITTTPAATLRLTHRDEAVLACETWFNLQLMTCMNFLLRTTRLLPQPHKAALQGWCA